jgi:hypothetical protein
MPIAPVHPPASVPLVPLGPSPPVYTILFHETPLKPANQRNSHHPFAQKADHLFKHSQPFLRPRALSPDVGTIRAFDLL